jgi:hypothetical protein
MQAKGMAPDVVTYNAAILACEEGYQREEAWRRMQGSGIKSLLKLDGIGIGGLHGCGKHVYFILM